MYVCRGYAQGGPPSSFFNTPGAWQAMATPPSAGTLFGWNTPVSVLPIAPMPPFSPGWNTNPCSSWITFPFVCGTALTDHSGGFLCNTSDQFVDYKILFTVTSPLYYLELEIWGDDRITSILVNGAPSGFVPTAPPAEDYFNSRTFKKCSGWNIGLNSIVITTRSAGPSGPQFVGHTGFKVCGKSPAPMTVSGTPSICPNSQGNYSASNVPGATLYSWNYYYGWSGGATGQAVTPTSPVTPGPFTSTVGAIASSSAGCLATAIMTVHIWPLPVITANQSPNPVCAGAPLNLSATGGITYTWTSAMPYSGVGSPVTVNPGPTIGTQFYVAGTNANGCKKSQLINVNVTQLPPISISAQPAVVCDGMPNILTASGASNYQWQGGPSTASWLQYPPTGQNSTYNVIGFANGCQNTAAITLTPGVTIPLSAPDVTLCTDLRVCATVSVSTTFTPPVTYTWQPGSINQQSFPICTNTPSSYTVSASSNSGCPATAEVSVIAQTCCPPIPITDIFALPTNTNCNYTYTDLAQYANVIGTFSGPGVYYNNGQYNFSTSGLSPGSHTITLTYTTAPLGCMYFLEQVVTVGSGGPLQMIGGERCAYSPLGTTIGGTLSGSSPATLYLWFPSLSNGPNITVSPTITTTYTLYAIAANGCMSTGLTTVNVNYTCCPQSSVVPVLGLSSIAAGGSLSGPIIIDQDLTITPGGNFTLQNGDFIINDNVKIILEPGVNLILSQAHLYACKDLWDGIFVQDGANVTSAPVPGPGGLCSMMEDAMHGINVTNITQAHAVPLLNLNGVVFNKNWYCIEISHSVLASIPLGIRSCVFTSRDIPTGTMSWPGSGTVQGGLRYSNSAASSLSPPYLFNGYPFMLANNSSYLGGGIFVNNIDSADGAIPPLAPGVSWGVNHPDSFNLFDYLQCGVYVRNASLTTYNNTFQNPGAANIWHYIPGSMNARLALSPPPPVLPNTAAGNRFWHNQWGASAYWGASWNPLGIIANHILEFEIADATFRGYTPWNYSPPPPPANFSTASGCAINVRSNRFENYSVRTCTFSNQPSTALSLNFIPGTYDVNGSNYGIYGNTIDIRQNLFMPQATFNSGYNPNTVFLTSAVDIQGDNNCQWNIPCLDQSGNIISSPTSYIRDNWVHYGHHGFQVVGMSNFPLGIIDNAIELAKPGVGINMYNTNGHKAIRNNQIIDIPFYPSAFVGINCFDNGIPHAITCNTVTGAGAGFRFWGNNICEWTGNVMDRNNIGLHLANSLAPTVIGQQGNNMSPSGNQWSACNFDTWVDAPSNAQSSPLYINLPPWNPGTPYSGFSFIPSNNQGSQGYNLTGVLPPAFQGTHMCGLSTGVPRSGNLTDIDILNTEEQSEITLFPNPSSGNIKISGLHENEPSSINITNVTGKTVYTIELQSVDSDNINISSLANGIYLVEIQNGNRKTIKKLVLTK